MNDSLYNPCTLCHYVFILNFYNTSQVVIQPSCALPWLNSTIYISGPYTGHIVPQETIYHFHKDIKSIATTVRVKMIISSAYIHTLMIDVDVQRMACVCILVLLASAGGKYF